MCRTHSSTMQIHKVTVQGHRFEPWILCPLCISFIPGRIFSKLWSNVHLSGTMCRTHNSALRTSGQGHSWRSQVWALNLVSAPFSFTPGRIFFKLWWNVCLSEMMCRTHSYADKVKVTVEGHQFEPWILRPLHCHSDCLVKFGSNVHLSEMMYRTYNSTMQIQGLGHNWRSSVSFLFAPYLLNPSKDFHETLVKCLP